MLWGIPTVKWVSIAIVLCLVALAEIIIVFIILPRLEYRLGDRKEKPRPLGIEKLIGKKRRVRIESPIKASNMIVTVKRRLQRAFAEYLRNSVTSDEEANDELNEIKRFLPDIAQYAI